MLTWVIKWWRKQWNLWCPNLELTLRGHTVGELQSTGHYEKRSNPHGPPYFCCGEASSFLVGPFTVQWWFLFVRTFCELLKFHNSKERDMVVGLFVAWLALIADVQYRKSSNNSKQWQWRAREYVMRKVLLEMYSCPRGYLLFNLSGCEVPTTTYIL